VTCVSAVPVMLLCIRGEAIQIQFKIQSKIQLKIQFKSVSACRYLAFHARGGNHCHLSFIGVPSSAAATAREVIEKAAMQNKFSLQHVKVAPPQEMREAVQALVQKSQYFQVYLPDGSRLVHPIGRCAPWEPSHVLFTLFFKPST
jgi:hypothetical protein